MGHAEVNADVDPGFSIDSEATISVPACHGCRTSSGDPIGGGVKQGTQARSIDAMLTDGDESVIRLSNLQKQVLAMLGLRSGRLLLVNILACCNPACPTRA